MKKLVLIALVGSLLTACTTMPVQVAGTIEKKTSKKVWTSVGHLNVFGFNPMSIAKTEKVGENLQSECGGSKVTGVTAVYSKTYVVIGNMEKIVASGYCE